MPNGILAGLSGALGGYEGALGFQYQQQKEADKAKLASERQLSLENLRATNQASLQQAGFTQQEKMAGLTETSRKEALAEERTYQAGLREEKQTYEAGAPERAWEAKQAIVNKDMGLWQESNPDATEGQIKARHDVLQGWAVATKGMDAEAAADVRLKAEAQWNALEPDTRDSKIAAYKQANPNSLNPADDARLEFASYMVSGRGVQPTVGEPGAVGTAEVRQDVIDMVLADIEAAATPAEAQQIRRDAEARFQGLDKILEEREMKGASGVPRITQRKGVLSGPGEVPSGQPVVRKYTPAQQALASGERQSIIPKQPW